MKSSFKLLIAATGLATAMTVSAATATGPWTITMGKTPPAISGTNASPVFGAGAKDSANSFGGAAAFAGGTLASAGDSIRLSGTVKFTGANPRAGEFRFGLFDVNGQSGNTGWLGYALTNASGTTAGQLIERESGNPNLALSIQGVTSLAKHTAMNDADFDGSDVSTYVFSLTYTRQSNGSLTIDYVLSNLAQLGSYQMSGSATDATPQTYTFNRVSFLAGGQLGAEKIEFTNIDVTYTAAH